MKAAHLHGDDADSEQPGNDELGWTAMLLEAFAEADAEQSYTQLIQNGNDWPFLPLRTLLLMRRSWQWKLWCNQACMDVWAVQENRPHCSFRGSTTAIRSRSAFAVGARVSWLYFIFLFCHISRWTNRQTVFKPVNQQTIVAEKELNCFHTCSDRIPLSLFVHMTSSKSFKWFSPFRSIPLKPWYIMGSKAREYLNTMSYWPGTSA